MTGELSPELTRRLSELSPEKRALLLRKLQQSQQASHSPMPPLELRSDSASLPLSFAQERLWFLWQMDPQLPVYNRPTFICLRGPLEPGVLERAFNELICRNQVLQTVYPAVDGVPQQQIRQWEPVRLPCVDLSRLSPKARQIELERLGRAAAREPFDLETGPIFRASLVRCEAEEHILLLVFHHIAFDAWSETVLLTELPALYEAGSHPESPRPAAASLQYADYACWQRKCLEGGHWEKDLVFWKQELSGELPVLELPMARPRSAKCACDGDTVLTELPKEIVSELRALCRQEQATLFVALLAVFKVLLWRYTGQEDIIVGCPIAGRSRKEIEPLLGCFINTLPIRSRMDGKGSFLDFLAMERTHVLRAMEHASFPFEKVIQAVNPARFTNQTPIFQTLLNFRNLPSVASASNGLHFTPWQCQDGLAQFDLSLDLTEVQDRMLCQWRFDRALFQRAEIEALAGHFQMLLRSLLAQPRRPLFQAAMLAAAEEHKLVDWNSTSSEYPRGQCIHELFEQQVRRTPEAVAIAFNDCNLTYAELNERANRLANYLIKRGVEPQTMVAICMERSIDLVVALLGILKAGGAYVPLDPKYPKSRLAFIIEDTHVPLIITTLDMQELFGCYQDRLLCLDEQAGQIAQQSAENPKNTATSDSLAYVMYTSGSTGQPKGVLVPQRGVVRLVYRANYLSITPDDVFLLFAPISFDASTFELWGPLLNGAKLAIFPPELSSLEQLSQALQHYGITTLWLTAGLFHQMVENHLDGLKGVRNLLAGGDVLSVSHVLKALRKLPGTRLVNGYGPTENTTFTCCHVIPTDWQGGQSVPIGRPISNTQVYIVDKHNQLVPVGVAGELLIGGDGLAQGYLNSPELTSTKFIVNCFDPAGSSRLYRSGDLARWLPDGGIEFLGRLDQQVKIRGFRVEPGEIEHALAQHPSVQECVVVARDHSGTPELAAYLVLRIGQTADAKELRKFLENRLPAYMIPAHLLLMEKLPLTPNGKIDRQRLPTPASLLPPKEFVAARTDEERKLAQIWSEVLGLKQIGIQDNFFELGGHSLLATQIISRTRARGVAELDLHDLFEAPSIAGLSDRIRTKGLRAADVSGPKPRNSPFQLQGRARLTTEDRLMIPPSFAQVRLWLLSQIEFNVITYNVKFAMDLEGALNRSAFERAIVEIVQRHESLRTTFTVIDGQPMQIITPLAKLEMPLIDLSHLSVDAAKSKAQERMVELASQPFDLGCDSLLRVELIRLTPCRHILVIVVHHIAFDGWSLGVFCDELSKCYEAFCNGTDCLLPPLPIQYADFSVWQRQWLQGAVKERLLSYWKNQLASAPQLVELPLDHPRPASQSFRGARQAVQLSAALTSSLNALSRQEGCTLFMTLLAVFQSLVFRCTGQEDIPVGTPIANRIRPEVEGLIGCFVNTIVLRTNFSGDPSFRQLLQRVRSVTLDAYAHQEMPFEQVIDALQPPRDASYTPVFQLLFVLQNTAKTADQIGALKATLLEIVNHTTKTDVCLHLWEKGDGLSGWIEYATDLYDAATMERFAGHFNQMLEAIVANPDEHISRLPLLSPGERVRLLLEWNQSSRDYPRSVCLHQLVQAQVARTPEAIAVEFEETRLSYRQLNVRSNRLARQLRGLKVGPDVLVGVCVERSPQMVIGLLAILKAGGAYVPLDPLYPQERQGFIVGDSQLSVILTQRSLLERVSSAVGNSERPLPAVLCVDDEPEAVANEFDSNLDSVTIPENLAYVLYTSGSTGQPKGVQIPHRAVVNFMTSMQEEPGLTASDRILAITTLSFDIAGLELWLPLISGACVVLTSAGLASDGKRLAEKIAQSGATVIQATPATWQMLLSTGWAGRPDLKLLCGGEAWSAELAGQLLSRCGSLWNMYGPTETTIWSAICKIDKATTPLIGKPIANTQLYVLDEHFELVPIGVAGELHIGGQGLAHGYVNRPELTAEKFVPDPFSGQPDARLYKTGDLVRRRPDGRIEFLGRTDFQVKIRGFRIELGEIESVLRANDAISEVVVMVRESSSGDKTVVAYLSAKQQPAPTSAELREQLKKKLPEYMIPNSFVVLPALPLTPNGKVDRKALSAVMPDCSDSRLAQMAPRNSLEMRLAGIWCEILEINKVGIHDNFFDLGGHSLLAMRLIWRIQNTFGKTLTLLTLFSAPTIAQLAPFLEEITLDKKDSTSPHATSGGLRGEGAGAPLFHIPGFWGYEFLPETMAQEVGKVRRFYDGLQYPGLDGHQEPLSRVEDIARHLVGQIQQVHPQGPYCLSGFSFGGVVAFEVARQMRAKGLKVDVVLLLDSYCPRSFSRRSLTRLFADLYIHLAKLNGRSRLRFLSKLVAKKMARRRFLVAQKFVSMKSKFQAMLKGGANAKSPDPAACVLQAAHLAARNARRPGPYKGRVVLCQVEERNFTFLFRSYDPSNGWSSLVEGELEVIPVPGDHGSLFDEPNVTVLSQKIVACLKGREGGVHAASLPEN